MPVQSLPVAEELWPAYELPNVQAALDAWLAEGGRTHTVVGITGQQFHPPVGLTDLMARPVNGEYGPRPGNVSRTNVPVGPDGETMACELYRGSLELDANGLDGVLDRTDGVTASFLKELLRRSAVLATDDEAADTDTVIVVGSDDMQRALADLLDTRNAMTRAVLGYADPAAAAAARAWTAGGSGAACRSDRGRAPTAGRWPGSAPARPRR